MPTKETMIYVIGPARGPKKIGLATSPTARLKSLQTGHGKPVSVLYARGVDVEISSAVERRAHWLLRESKTHGEWFRVSLDIAKAAVDRAVADRGEGDKESRSVGRPPLKATIETKPTMVRLTEDVRVRIEAVAGKNRMAIFIREAVENELRRRERAKPKPPPS